MKSISRRLVLLALPLCLTVPPASAAGYDDDPYNGGGHYADEGAYNDIPQRRYSGYDDDGVAGPGRFDPEPGYRDGPGSAYGGPEEPFFDRLAPYGDWMEMPEYGLVWRPRGTPQGWRPYTHGRWVATDDGWTWLSDWEWGWAPFHYGRWLHDRRSGWVWVPGDEWAPAWVDWREGDGLIGWAPLPPRVGWGPHLSLSLTFIDRDLVLPASEYYFVHDRVFLEPQLHRHILPPARNVTLVKVTRNVTKYVVVNRRVVNRSVDLARLEHVLRRPVPRHRIVEHTDLRVRPGQALRGNDLLVFRPGLHRQRGQGAATERRSDREHWLTRSERRDATEPPPQGRTRVPEDRRANTRTDEARAPTPRQGERRESVRPEGGQAGGGAPEGRMPPWLVTPQRQGGMRGGESRQVRAAPNPARSRIGTPRERTEIRGEGNLQPRPNTPLEQRWRDQTSRPSQRVGSQPRQPAPVSSTARSDRGRGPGFATDRLRTPTPTTQGRQPAERTGRRAGTATPPTTAGVSMRKAREAADITRRSKGARRPDARNAEAANADPDRSRRWSERN